MTQNNFQQFLTSLIPRIQKCGTATDLACDVVSLLIDVVAWEGYNMARDLKRTEFKGRDIAMLGRVPALWSPAAPEQAGARLE